MYHNKIELSHPIDRIEDALSSHGNVPCAVLVYNRFGEEHSCRSLWIESSHNLMVFVVVASVQAVVDDSLTVCPPIEVGYYELQARSESAKLLPSLC